MLFWVSRPCSIFGYYVPWGHRLFRGFHNDDCITSSTAIMTDVQMRKTDAERQGASIAINRRSIISNALHGNCGEFGLVESQNIRRSHFKKRTMCEQFSDECAVILGKRESRSFDEGVKQSFQKKTDVSMILISAASYDSILPHFVCGWRHRKQMCRFRHAQSCGYPFGAQFIAHIITYGSHRQKKW